MVPTDRECAAIADAFVWDNHALFRLDTEPLVIPSGDRTACYSPWGSNWTPPVRNTIRCPRNFSRISRAPSDNSFINWITRQGQLTHTAAFCLWFSHQPVLLAFVFGLWAVLSFVTDTGTLGRNGLSHQWHHAFLGRNPGRFSSQQR